MWEMQVNKVLFDLLYEKKIQYNDIAMYGVAAEICTVSSSLSALCMRSFLLSNVNSLSTLSGERKTKIASESFGIFIVISILSNVLLHFLFPFHFISYAFCLAN